MSLQFPGKVESYGCLIHIMEGLVGRLQKGYYCSMKAPRDMDSSGCNFI